MRLIRCLKDFKHPGGYLGLSIGNFDGLHVGHQHVFNTLERACVGEGRYLRALLTFVPHPRLYFSGVTKEEIQKNDKYWQVTSFRRKLQIAKDLGFDFFFALRFNESFASLGAEEFVKNIIVDGIRAKQVSVGHDWAFGKGREGSIDTLKELGGKYGFGVNIAEACLVEGVRVSTSTVKTALQSGDLDLVKRYLGRPFYIEGRVIQGNTRGRGIGFPTANIRRSAQVLPKDGVYATYCNVDQTVHPSVTNVGVRPTVDGVNHFVETHILGDYSDNLYDKRIGVRFVSRIRDEMKFKSVDELKTQIAKDCVVARDILDNSIP